MMQRDGGRLGGRGDAGMTDEGRRRKPWAEDITGSREEVKGWRKVRWRTGDGGQQDGSGDRTSAAF